MALFTRDNKRKETKSFNKHFLNFLEKRGKVSKYLESIFSNLNIVKLEIPLVSAKILNLPKSKKELKLKNAMHQSLLGEMKLLENVRILRYVKAYLFQLLCLSDHKKKVPTRTIEQRHMVGARIKIMWEEQLVDPPTDYITSVNVP